MKTPQRSSIRRKGAVLLAALTLSVAAAPAPASAQGFLEMLFGGRFHRRAPEPPQASSFADPFDSRRAESGSFGHGVVYCVRTCDGRYFPLQRLGGASPAELCQSFCPAAKTMVFSGSKIDTAVAQNGTRYADLDNAFAYRDKLVDNCTCNGKDGGLAHLDTASDPTLRPGDIVATNNGLAVYQDRGKKGEFTPIGHSAGEWARRLSEIKVRPAPPEEKIEARVNEEPSRLPRRGRQQAAQY